LGIDPGSVITGYGVIFSDGYRHRHVDHGCLRTGGGAMSKRLKLIFEGVLAIIDQHHPDAMAIESVFVKKNPASALKLGQARAAAICASVLRDCAVSEYAPREVKKALVGNGAAEKSQVAHMVGIMLRLHQTLQADASDALAIALCHAHSMTSPLQAGTT